MRKIGVCGVLAAIGLMAASKGAYAQVINVDCTGNPGALATQFSGATPGGTANTTYQITGPCNGNFGITQSNISITTAVAGAAQTINGAILINGATNATLNDLTINGQVAALNSAEVNILPITATFTIQGVTDDGVLAAKGATVNISSTTIQNNTGDGLHAIAGAVIVSNGNTITGNGGVGILVELGSAVNSQNDTISQGSAPNSPAAAAKEASSLRLIGDAVTGPSNNQTVLVSQGSSVLILSSNITTNTPFNANDVLAAVAAARGSTITLAGGNTITNSAAGGAAVLVSEGSTLVEDNGTPEGNIAQTDIITGDGRVNTQSVIELGAAAGGGGITWTGNVVVSQFSSFRADGDNVTITNTLSLGQAGNAYFNETKGTSNNIAHVVCQSTTDHVANPTLVTPNVAIGAPPLCQTF